MEQNLSASNLSLTDCNNIINDADIAQGNKDEMLTGIRAAASAIANVNRTDFDDLILFSLYSFL